MKTSNWSYLQNALILKNVFFCILIGRRLIGTRWNHNWSECQQYYLIDVLWDSHFTTVDFKVLITNLNNIPPNEIRWELWISQQLIWSILFQILFLQISGLAKAFISAYQVLCAYFRSLGGHWSTSCQFHGMPVLEGTFIAQWNTTLSPGLVKLDSYPMPRVVCFFISFFVISASIVSSSWNKSSYSTPVKLC